MFVELNRDEWKDDIEGKERAIFSSETIEKRRRNDKIFSI